MAYMKSVLAGIAASTAALAVLYAVTLLFGVRLKHTYLASHPSDDTVFFEWHWHFWPVLFIELLVFAFGFYWEFQRASIQSSPR
jgi:hypothetical protein